VRLSPNVTIFGTLFPGAADGEAATRGSVGGFEGAPLHAAKENANKNAKKR
jgi:hypothetical protein